MSTFALIIGLLFPPAADQADAPGTVVEQTMESALAFADENDGGMRYRGLELLILKLEAQH